MRTEDSTLFISKKPECVEAAYITKHHAIEWFRQYHGLSSLNKGVSGIGDTSSDHPFLAQVELPFAPANAKEETKNFVRERGGIVTQSPTYLGFLEALAITQKKGLEHFIVDRDGIVWQKGEIEFERNGLAVRSGEDFSRLTRSMGTGALPLMTILTASSYDQNEEFLKKYGLNKENLLGVDSIRDRSKIVIMENGAVILDVLSGGIIPYYEEINPRLADLLLGPFKDKVRERIEQEIFSGSYPDLDWSENYNEQDGKLFVPKKASMLTINVPRSYSHRKITDYRKSPGSEILRKQLYKIFTETAKDMGLSWQHL